MLVVAYEVNFHALSHFTNQLVRTEEERICFFVKGLSSEIEVLLVHMTSTRKSFNDVTDYVKKLEGVRKMGGLKHWVRGPRMWETRMVPIQRVLVNKCI